VRSSGATCRCAASETSTAPIISALVSAGVSVEEVRKGKESLEEAFLAIMEDEKEEA
jgi:hypothetical protein